MQGTVSKQNLGDPPFPRRGKARVLPWLGLSGPRAQAKMSQANIMQHPKERLQRFRTLKDAGRR